MGGMTQLVNRAISKDIVKHVRGEKSPVERAIMPMVSIIIPTSNSKQFVMNCLNSLANVVYPNLEIIVIDNASSDGTSSLISKNFPDVMIIRNKRNLGYAAGNNLGIRNAGGQYLILLNDDTLVDPYFVSRLVEAMEAEPKAALGSCKIYMINGKKLQYTGGFIDEMGYPLMRGCGEDDKGQYDRFREVEWASGSCMIIRRKYLDKIGLLDDSFYFYYEDTDLSFRARKRGYKVIYIPMAVIRHFGSATTRRHWRYQIFSTRNRFKFLLRHFGNARTARAIAWDFLHTPPRKIPYLLIGLLWSYSSILSSMFTALGKNSYYSELSIESIRYVLYYWRVIMRVFLNTLLGKMRFYRMLGYHAKLNILFHPFFIVRVFDSVVQTKVGGNLTLQPLDNLFLNEEIDFMQVYDKFYNVNKEDIIIDVGAHAGVFSLRAARKVENGLVLAIEPHPFNYMLLTNNVKIDKLSNILTSRVALWSNNGTMKLYLSGSGSHSLKPYLKDRNKYIEVQTRTLDTIVKELGINRVNFIKIDVEGAELEVLRGAEEVLKDNDPFLSIAAYHTPTEVTDISQFLWKKGYRVFIYESDYLYGFKAKGNTNTILRNDLNMNASNHSMK